MIEPYEWDVTEAARNIRERHISSLEYVGALLARIDAINSGIQAWARIDRESLRVEARKCDDDAQHGRWRGPLHGMPIAVKDNFATAGLETCANSLMLAGNVPSENADAVQLLREAGSFTLGKTAMTEFAAMDPAPTRNPWNVERTPGGSSSGSAAAVAARMCPAALGSQTAGSVVRPAAYCGVVGLKPTYAAVGRKGLIPCAWSMDHVGVFARSTADIAMLFRALAPQSAEHTPTDSAPIIIGVPDRYFFEQTDADVGTAFEDAISLLAAAGARILRVELPQGFEALVEAGIVTMYAEMAAYQRERFAKRASEFPPRLSILIEAGLTISAADYLRAQQIRRIETVALSRLLAPLTALAMPSTPAPAPGFDSTGDWRLNLPFSHSGHPAMTIPCGMSKHGLPIGLQLAARHSGEDRLFQVGALFQTRSDWHQRSPAIQPTGVQ